MRTLYAVAAGGVLGGMGAWAVGGPARVVAQDGPALPAVQKWEYTTERFAISDDPGVTAKARAAMNRLGDESWELVATGGGNRNDYGYFKRPKR